MAKKTRKKTRRSSTATRKKTSRKRPVKKQAARPRKRSRSAPESGYSLKDENVENAILRGQHRELLEAYFGEEGLQELQSLATRARSRSVRGGPRVLVLPGIMGSKLGTPGLIFDDTIWVDPLEIAAGNLEDLSLDDGDPDIESLGVILFAYLQLKLRLKLAGFDADFYHFDWRQSIDRLGQELANRITDETKSGRSGSTLYLVAHSMGGLVSRSAFAILKKDGEESRVRRLLMLGTPNFGSFAPVQAIQAVYSTVRKVAALDLKHSAEELSEKVFSTLPGLYQMLPWPQKFSAVDLYQADVWPDDRPGPRQAILNGVPKIHDHLGSGNERFALIAGVGQDTTIGLEKDGEGKFVYLNSNAGDGTVPLELAQLPDVDTYYVEEGHGNLPNNQQVIRAVIDLLDTGRTDVLPTSWTRAQRAAPKRLKADKMVEDVPFEGRTGKDISPRELRFLVEELAAPPERIEEAAIPIGGTATTAGTSDEPIIVGRRRQHRIDLRLAHGSITEVDARAVVLGLFRDVKPTGAARAIDEQIEGAITDFTDRHMFSGNVGEVFILPTGRQSIRAELVVFAGLGSFAEFDDEVLRITAENVARTLVRTKVDEFATVLMGAGSGTALGDSLASLVDGFFRGMLDSDKDHRLRSITLCEFDSARFEQLSSEMLRLSTTTLFDEVEVTVDRVTLPEGRPADDARTRLRLDVPDPVYLIVEQEAALIAEPNAAAPAANAPITLQYSVLTAGGKATVLSDSHEVNPVTLKRHLERIEMDSFTSANLRSFGEKLTELVLPEMMRDTLKSMQDRVLLIIHDAQASQIPWETICIDGWFPAGKAGLSRKYAAENLSVAKWLEERRTERVINLLLIVNPTGDLDGAEREGNQILNLFKDNPSVDIQQLRGPEAMWNAVRAELRSGRYDVVHYAGHAHFDPVHRSRSGILCHGNRVLSGADLAGIEGLPALAFFNACEAGRVRTARARRGGEAVRDRINRNVGLAEAFLRGGVANYVGTYWPVGDAGATKFAAAFYTNLLTGKTLNEALTQGRKEVRDLPSVDWADYIHYGSPGFRLKLP